MKTRLLMIIVVVLAIAITSAFLLNYYVEKEIKSQKLGDEQIDRIFERCDYQKRMNDRNWIGFDGNKITDHQPLYVWDNSTHHLDNNSCKWQTLEKYESDTQLRDALARCWTGNSEFLDDDFVLWNNKTHYIDIDTCLIAEVSPNSESKVMDSLIISNTERDAKLAAGYKLYPGIGWVHPDEQKNPPEPIYIKNPNNPDEIILDVDAMIWVQQILDKCEYIKKLESGKIPWRNSDGSFNVIRGNLPFFNNGTHYIDSNHCNWVDSLESITYNCFEANPMEQNWHSGPGYFDNGTHYLDAQKCEWMIYSEE